jgi:hypothetical protein
MMDKVKVKVQFKLLIKEQPDDPNPYRIYPDFSKLGDQYIEIIPVPTNYTHPTREQRTLSLEVTIRPTGFDGPWPATMPEKLDSIFNEIVADGDSEFESQKTRIIYELVSRRSVTLITREPIEISATETGETKDETGPQENRSSSLDQRSGTVPSSVGKVNNPVTLQRSARALTGDVALWLMIKMNAKNLGWDNYQAHLELLFGSEDPTKSKIYDDAQRLSRRRFLPFTDTDAYRTLKVATEAFVVSWGGVVPANAHEDKVYESLLGDADAIQIASDRLGIEIDGDLALATAKQYFAKSSPPTIPYLTRVIQGLRGTDAEKVADEAREDEERQKNKKDIFCGESCLWLAPLNSDMSTKLSRPPFTELIWCYWMEEMQLVQTMNAISRRFQNISSGPHDPLTPFELDPVRRLNNLIWSHVQDEQHRLPIERRAAEYQHEYGLRLFGRAVPSTRAADVRSKFLAAFHTLLNQCVPYFRQADDTTVVPDAFPLLNALREVHLVLSEGAHNQFLDLPNTARIEMMMQQWILARPEFREFLPRRAMIAYPEPWMHSVESMRKLQGWGDTSTFQFWQLATTGEQIVSSIRWGDWNSITDATNAANWAAFFRPEIQTYIHSYRAVTGIDVSAEPVDVQVPGMHLLRRLQEQQRSRVGSRSMAP